jgi:hypothetical protein
MSAIKPLRISGVKVDGLGPSSSQTGARQSDPAGFQPSDQTEWTRTGKTERRHGDQIRRCQVVPAG